MRGEITFVQTQENFDAVSGGGGKSKWADPVRLGPRFTQDEVDLRREMSIEIADACGIPSVLLSPLATGTAARSAFSRWLDTAVEPMAAVIAEEVSAKLETDDDFKFDFTAVKRPDSVLILARTVGTLVQSGMTLDKALVSAGLVDGDA